MNEAFIFNYEFDKDTLLSLWNSKYIHNTETYDDPRIDDYIKRPEFIAQYGHWSKDVWKIAHAEVDEYTKYLCDYFDINAKPRFYMLKANQVLPHHIDNDTECAINFILSDDAAPITFQATDNTYHYRTALLNTSLWHGVWNGPKDRILFKLSIFDEPFEIVKEKISKKLGTQ